MLCTKLKFYTAFHPQTNGQFEVVYRNLVNLLRTLAGEHVKTWDLKLSTAELAYNTSVNRTIGKGSHEVVYDFRPRQPINLIPVTDYYRTSESAIVFASNMHQVHKKISDKIAQNNANYKL